MHASRPHFQPPRRGSSQSKTKFREVDSECFLSKAVSLTFPSRPASPRQLLGRGPHGSQLTRSRARPPAHLVGEVRSQVTGAKGEAEQGPPQIHQSALPASRDQAAEPSQPPQSLPPCHEAPLRQSAGRSPGRPPL